MALPSTAPQIKEGCRVAYENLVNFKLKEVAKVASEGQLPNRRVLFPGVHLADEPLKRARWKMLRQVLYRHTYKNFSREKLDQEFTDRAIAVDLHGFDSATTTAITESANILLSRLPTTPLPLPNNDQPSNTVFESSWCKVSRWEDLPTVAKTSATVSRVGIAIAMTRDSDVNANACHLAAQNFRSFLDDISDLIDGAFIERDKVSAPCDRWRWFIVLSYLWCIWQRCLALHYWRVLEDSLASGFDYNELGELALRPNKGSFLCLTSTQDTKSLYMCSLAYRVLQRSRSTFLMDLRHFHTRFSDIFGQMEGRCVGNKSCSGLHPKDCQRFVGAETNDQSQHDISCNIGTNSGRCGRMKWSKGSYLGLSGPRAVSIDSPFHQLHYQPANKDTLAISHVWSHGQGGRPEHGLNECLHRRYCEVAKLLKCSSYWIDAACIPKDSELRSEAIMTINRVFSSSRATLLCDRDLMDIDISTILDPNNTSDASMALRESILAIVLVCDWNVRAWTLLEALRGRHNIQLLCRSEQLGESQDNLACSKKGNAVISLTDILRVVASHGAINMAILLLTSFHMFPAPTNNSWIKFRTKNLTSTNPTLFEGSHDAMLISNRIGGGFVTVSEGASLLAQRFTSHPRDDIIIWSLLVHEPRLRNSRELWAKGKSKEIQLDRMVHTGHLLSSVPRLTSTDLPGESPSWAPSQPGLGHANHDMSPASELYPPYDGSQSQIGLIEFDREGRLYLRASWAVATIHSCRDGARVFRKFRRTDKLIEDAPVPDKIKEYLEGYEEGKLLQPLQKEENVEKEEGDSQGTPICALAGTPVSTADMEPFPQASYLQYAGGNGGMREMNLGHGWEFLIGS